MLFTPVLFTLWRLSLLSESKNRNKCLQFFKERRFIGLHFRLDGSFVEKPSTSFYFRYAIRKRLTFARATAGNESHASSWSSPRFPRRCPRSILAAVAVATPIPSPTNNTTFLACGRRSVAYCSLFRKAIRACSYQYSWSETRNSAMEWNAHFQEFGSWARGRT